MLLLDVVGDEFSCFAETLPEGGVARIEGTVQDILCLGFVVQLHR